MNPLFAIVLLLPLTVVGVEEAGVTCLLTNAASVHDNSYLAARQKLLNLGSNALPLLAQAAVDTNTDWRAHLVARICYEHITRGNDIKALRNQDWTTYPPYQPGSKEMQSILGPTAFIGRFVTDRCVEYGLWYYYAELMWKNTREFPETAMGVKFTAKWPWWCSRSLAHTEEKWYRSRILAEYFERANPSDAGNIDIYAALLAERDPDFVPLLIRRYDEFKNAVPGPDFTSESWAPTKLPGKIDTILSFSDSRHVAQIEKFLAEHSAASLTNRLPEVRARRTRLDELPEPPFRLGTNLIVVAPQP